MGHKTISTTFYNHVLSPGTDAQLLSHLHLFMFHVMFFNVHVIGLIIYMKKLLDYDWLRTKQCSFSLTQCRKEIIECKKR